MERLTVSVDPQLDAAFPGQRAARIEILLRDGRRLSHLQPNRKGDPEQPLSDSELEDKLLELASPVIGAAAPAMTRHAYICDAVRTPFGRYGGALSSVRADDLGALPLRELMRRNPSVDWRAVDDVIYGCANQAGEDNRNVARMSSLLAGLPLEVPGSTVNRLCGSGMDAVGTAARAIKSGEAELMLAGGVESMSRAPFVMPKAETAFSRNNAVYDTTIGWRFVNKRMKEQYGIDSMPETAENVAAEFGIEREAQDRMALASQQKAVAAQQRGFFDAEITPLT
eukprot:gene50120-67114_t